MHQGYEKLKIVGKGSFGTATLYKRLADNKYVVMKEIITTNLDESEKKSALNEVEIIATLNHPNIIRYFGNTKENDAIIIIMEYADAGNLAQLINSKKNRNDVFSELGILEILSQITSGISYMHMRKILHRDLKTSNIFIKASGTIKIGDFGISKVLNTKSQAQTVVGTPYYLSPEMCEGSDYNEKSDIWAIGCILYELACLKKPFEAQTLPVLVKKITKCEYEEIPEQFSAELSIMLKSILQKNHISRPSAFLINTQKIPAIFKKHDVQNQIGSKIDNKGSKVRSVLYEIKDFAENLTITPIDLPHKEFIDISVSKNHHIAITSDHIVYAWGANGMAQLGLSQIDSYRKVPVCIRNLNNKSIFKSAAGFGFSFFLSKGGLLYSCGINDYGCLGHGKIHKVLEPMIIIKIIQIVCGSYHAVALSSDGKVYTWGFSNIGALGQGHMQKRDVPFPIVLYHKVQSVFCTDDATMLLTYNGQILACGSNKYNKLGFSNQENITTFKVVAFNSSEKIVQIAMSNTFTLVLNKLGHVTIFGRNTYIKETFKLNNILHLTCGPDFAAFSDDKNVVWFLGKYKEVLETAPTLTNSFSSTLTTLTKFNSLASLLNGNCSDANLVRQFDETVVDDSLEKYNFKIVQNPKSILALHSSQKNVADGNTICINNILAKENSLLVLVNTTTSCAVKTFEGD